MRKSTKVTQIYLELRKSLPASVAPAEVLESANLLVDLFEEPQPAPSFSLRRGGIPFDERDVDSVMSDGGWRVLCRTPVSAYQCEEIDRYLLQDAYQRSGLTEYFPELRL